MYVKTLHLRILANAQIMQQTTQMVVTGTCSWGLFRFNNLFRSFQDLCILWYPFGLCCRIYSYPFI